MPLARIDEAERKVVLLVGEIDAAVPGELGEEDPTPFAKVSLDRGRVVLDASMEDVQARYLEVVVGPDRLAAARGQKPAEVGPLEIDDPVLGGKIRLQGRIDRLDLIAVLKTRE